MPHAIRPLTPDDLPALSRFLTTGFHAPADAPFAAIDVLRWKYFDPRGAEAGSAPRSLVGCDEASGEIVGHVGICPARWHGPGLSDEGVSTLHMIDWLASAAGAGVGAQLMRRAHQSVDTQYGFGGSAAGRGVIDRGGYGLIQHVPVYQRVLRPLHRLRVPGQGLVGRLLRVGKDVWQNVRRRPRASSMRLVLERQEAFDDQILPVLAAAARRVVFTTREPALLNHLLRFPRGGLTGWLIRGDAGALLGFGLLSVVPQPGGVRLGRIVDCLLASEDARLMSSALQALTDELGRQGADLAQAFASTPEVGAACALAGFTQLHALEFRLRDRRGLLPADAAFHLTPLEADYAYV